MTPQGQAQQFTLDLPGGGKLYLQSLDEVELLEAQKDAYEKDYTFDKLNDRVLFGSLLTQQLALYRGQQTISGMEPEFDAKERPTGFMIRRTPPPKPAEMKAAQDAINSATGEIMKLEKALGIDKKTRESGGQHTLIAYLTTLKRAANEFGIQVNERTKAYEAFAMEGRTKLRILFNADAEDRQYHGITEKGVLTWFRDELARLEQIDKDFAKQKGELWRGKL